MQKYITKESFIKSKGSSFIALCDSKPIENKADIVRFFAKCISIGDGSGVVTDRMTGKATGEYEKMFQDGDYVWYADEVYHFKKYNLHLNDDFVSYVMTGGSSDQKRDDSVIKVIYTSHKDEAMAKIKGAIRTALEICGGTAEGHAKEKCPVATGNLRNSIAHEMRSDETVAIGTNVYYAPYVELGTCKMGAKPYLRPALDEHKSEYIGIVKGELGKI